MAEVCPYRVHKPEPKPPPRKRLPCLGCDKGHISETALLICQTKHTIRTQYNQPWSPDGTTDSLYPLYPREWSREYSTAWRAWIWPTLAGWITHRDGNRCQDCGIHADTIIGEDRWGSDEHPIMEVHHIIPRANGGGDHPFNLKLVCQNCHKKYNEQFNGQIISKKAQERKTKAIKEVVPKSLEQFEAGP
jgi:5-methylcytosine-specific restriction protein A